MSNQLTEVRLLSVPLENDYKHTLYFDTSSKQINYFVSKTKHTFLNCSYQRKDGYVRIPMGYDEISDCNYLMYQNSLTGKYYFAFITKIEYKDDSVSWVYIETDVMQTYHFNYSIKPSFVEREHVKSDKIGLHTVPEGLELGDYIVKVTGVIGEPLSTKIVMGVTEIVPTGNDDGRNFGGKRYSGLYSGIGYYAFTNISMINDIIQAYANGGKTDAIQCLFYAPDFVCPTIQDGVEVIGSETPHTIEKQFSKEMFRDAITENSGYNPNNNKLKTFPFQYLNLSNNNGGSAVYYYEYFKDDNFRFKIYGCLTPGCSIRIVPLGYKYHESDEINNEEGLNLGKYPICNWTSDVYTNWLTQNSVNIGLNLVASGGQIVAGTAMTIASGGIGGAIGGTQIIGGVSGIANQLAQIHEQSFTPPQSRGNINCGDVTTAMSMNTFTLSAMTIKPEMMKILDGYFDMFGYKVNSVKIPERNHRQNYWFTKTIDISIDGNMPQEDLQKIKSCYNNGLTFWSNPDNIGDYSVTNKPLYDIAEG